MTSLTGLSPNNPRDYVGPNVALNTVVTRNRAPTGADYRQPETGKLYPFNTYWLVGKDPTTGVQGDLWYLSKIAGNVAFWLQLSTGSSGPLLQVDLDVATPPGVDPTSPDGSGLLGIHGAAVAGHSVPVETHARALNEFNIEVQYANQTLVATPAQNGLAHFDAAKFSADPSTGFVSTSIGDFSSLVVSGTGIVLSSGSAQNMLILNLTPGYWLVQGHAQIQRDAITGTYFEITLSSTSGTRGNPWTAGACTPYPATATGEQTLTTPSVRSTRLVAAPVYLVAYADFTVGTVRLWGQITATKIGNL